jgi:hypothetical protein
MEISKIIISIFIFYLLIFCNYTKELIGCKLNYYLSTNIYAKHLIAFLLLYFLIIIVDSDNIENTYLYNIGISFIVYILFIITTRIPYYLIIPILILLIILYIINKIKKKEQEKNAAIPISPYEKNEVDKYFYMELSLILIIILLMSIGFIYYGLEKYCEYGKKFSILTFIIGNTTCKNS